MIFMLGWKPTMQDQILSQRASGDTLSILGNHLPRHKLLFLTF